MKELVINDFREWCCDRYVDAQSRRSARLAPTYLLANESGVVGDLVEELTEAKWSRTSFHLYSSNIKNAELLFYVNASSVTRDTPMRLLVNGHAMNHRQERDRMLTGGWDRKRISAKYLREGDNQFTFSHNGELYVDPHSGGYADVRLSQSECSFDGGKSWHQDALGENRDLRGEYLVRLRVKGHPPKGQLTSPVIDIIDEKDKGLLAPQLGVQKLQLSIDSEIPKAAEVNFEMRSGSTPQVDPRTWTPWESVKRVSWPGRFVQIRVHLCTNSADVTPILKKVILEIDIKEDQNSLTGIKLEELDQPDLVYGSYPFTYLAPHARLERLRKQHRLDDVIAPGNNELEQLALLRDWVHSQWLGWQASKYPYCPPWDPLEILETTKGDWGFGMCTHYGATYAGCASALGWVSRVLIVDHHCLAEVWCETIQKWILQDAGPCREYDASYEIDGQPINALELHEALRAGRNKDVMSNKLPQNVVEPMDHHINSFCRFGIPLRNNHLTHSEPAELCHGYRQYHYDGYLWWSDHSEPIYSEYSLQTTRAADFYWSVNQTRVYLQATDVNGLVRAQFKHTMPNFSHFSISFDGQSEQREESIEIEWTLSLGRNELSVHAVNTFGRAGRPVRAVINYDPVK